MPTKSLYFFISNALRRPRQIGAILPSSNMLGKAMAEALQQPIYENGISSNEIVDDLVEFGPGTGQITKFLPKQKLTLVEIEDNFCSLLKKNYPEANIINKSAIDVLKETQQCFKAVSSIPLLKNPQSNQLKNAIKQSYHSGFLKKLVIYSYGQTPPLSDCGFKVEIKIKTVIMNLPPAHVWLYA